MTMDLSLKWSVRYSDEGEYQQITEHTGFEIKTDIFAVYIETCT